MNWSLYRSNVFKRQKIGNAEKKIVFELQMKAEEKEADQNLERIRACQLLYLKRNCGGCHCVMSSAVHKGMKIS